MPEQYVASGKRKAAVARAVLTPGKKEIRINKKSLNYLHSFDRLRMEEPLRIAKEVIGKDDFNVEITVKSGGEKSQIEAARLALAKAIIAYTKSKELKEAYMVYDKHLLVADVRRKETYKPGDSKARSKRQTSYR